MGNGMWCMCLPRAHIWSLWCKTPRCQQLLWLLWFKVESRGKNSADLATRCHPQASAQKVVACWDPDWSEKHGVKWWKVEGCGTLLFFILLVEFWILSPGYHLQKTSNYDQLVCWWDQTIYIYIIFDSSWCCAWITWFWISWLAVWCLAFRFSRHGEAASRDLLHGAPAARFLF